MLQHDDGLRHVVLHFESFLFGEGSFSNRKVVQFPPIIEVKGDFQGHAVFFIGLLSPDIPGNNMFRPILQKELPYRKTLSFTVRRGGEAAQFAPGKPEMPVKMAVPGDGSDLPKPFNGPVFHEFAAQVALGHKGVILLKFILFFAQILVRPPGIFSLHHRFEVFNPGIPQQNFESCPNFMEAVVDRFQLGGLIYHIFGGGHFAAVVKPGGILKFTFFFRIQGEVGKGAGGMIYGFLTEKPRYFRNPFAVFRRIMAFCIDGAGHKPD